MMWYLTFYITHRISTPDTMGRKSSDRADTFSATMPSIILTVSTTNVGGGSDSSKIVRYLDACGGSLGNGILLTELD